MTKSKQRWPFRGVLTWDAKSGRFREVKKEKKKSVDAPFVITDEIPATMSMTGTDNVYTSKAKLRDEYRRMGFIETGGERAKPEPPPKANFEEIRDTVEKSLQDLKYGRVPVSERESAVAAEEERQWEAYKKRNS